MISSANHDGCRSAKCSPLCARMRPFRRTSGHLKAKKRIFPQILSRQYRIATPFCRQRWFLRYARSESLLCLRNFASSLQAMGRLTAASALSC